MSNANPRRLILANGEKYVQTEERQGHGRAPELPRTYAEASALVIRQLDGALRLLNSQPPQKRLPDEAVLCLRLHPDMTAKSYDPKGLFTYSQGLENVGSRTYKTEISKVAQTKRIKKLAAASNSIVTGRMVFVKGGESDFRGLIELLKRPESAAPRAFQEDIQRIERFDLLQVDEQLQGFDDDWEEGRVELVLHPSHHSEQGQLEFISGRAQGSE